MTPPSRSSPSQPGAEAVEQRGRWQPGEEDLKSSHAAPSLPNAWPTSAYCTLQPVTSSTGRLHLGPLPVFRLADDLEVLLRLVPDLVAVHARALLSVGVTGTEGARLPGSGGVRAWKQRGVVRFHAEQDVEQRVGVDNVRPLGVCQREPLNRLHRFRVTNAIRGERFSGPALGRRNPVEQPLYPRDVVGQVVALNGPDGVRQFDPGGTGTFATPETGI